jgi:dipeptidase E
VKLALLSDNSTAQGIEAVTFLLESTGVPREKISIGYIASCPDPSRTFFEKTLAFYNSLGINSVTYLDLEGGFNNELAQDVCSKTVIHLSGGNTYRFLYWLKQRNLGCQLRKLAHSGKPMIGVSAGAMLLTPSVITAELCGDINHIQLPNETALSIIPFLFCAHSSQDTVQQERASEISAQTGYEVVMCKDSDALFFDNGQLREFGTPVWASRI